MKMSNINRIIDVDHPLTRKSLFLFGPRQTGKTTYLETQLKNQPSLRLSLLDSALFREFSARPEQLRKMIEAKNLCNTVVSIDEIQKCPALLDEIHALICFRKTHQRARLSQQATKNAP
jgi:predicted AAA+ superfamily ATPase